MGSLHGVLLQKTRYIFRAGLKTRGPFKATATLLVDNKCSMFRTSETNSASINRAIYGSQLCKSICIIIRNFRRLSSLPLKRPNETSPASCLHFQMRDRSCVYSKQFIYWFDSTQRGEIVFTQKSEPNDQMCNQNECSLSMFCFYSTKSSGEQRGELFRSIGVTPIPKT